MIEIKNLYKNFGDKMIFEDFNLKIKSENMIAIVGKSGSGKTTLLNIIGLLDSEYSGDIIYDGISMKSKKEKFITKYIRDNINYLFQNYALIDNENVFYNLELALAYEKLSKAHKKELINNALEEVDLGDKMYEKVYTLSGGEQQRISLARVILKKGNIILADEPTGNLDDDNTSKVINVLKKFKKDGKTVIVVTHDEKIAKQCDKIINL